MHSCSRHAVRAATLSVAAAARSQLARSSAARAAQPTLAHTAALTVLPSFSRSFSSASASAHAQPAESARPAYARRPKPSGAPVRSGHAAYVGPPLLSSLLKRFNLLVHPDLFGDAPSQQAANQQSLQALNSLLSSLRTREKDNEYPPQQKLQIVFYVRKRHGDDAYFRFIRGEVEGSNNGSNSNSNNNKGSNRKLPSRMHSKNAAAKDPPRRGDVLQNEFHIVPVLLTTTGGNCKQLLAGQLASMFLRAGLPVKEFRWDADYWQMGGPVGWAKRQPMEDKDDDDEYY